MSASQQAPAPPPLKKGIVKQVSVKIGKFFERIFFGYSLPTQQMESDRNMFFFRLNKNRIVAIYLRDLARYSK